MIGKGMRAQVLAVVGALCLGLGGLFSTTGMSGLVSPVKAATNRTVTPVQVAAVSYRSAWDGCIPSLMGSC